LWVSNNTHLVVGGREWSWVGDNASGRVVGGREWTRVGDDASIARVGCEQTGCSHCVHMSGRFLARRCSLPTVPQRQLHEPCTLEAVGPFDENDSAAPSSCTGKLRISSREGSSRLRCASTGVCAHVRRDPPVLAADPLARALTPV